MGEQRWVKRFTVRGRTGAYLRVLTPGPVQAGDAVVVESRPDHEITVPLMFRALTTERHLLPRLDGGRTRPQRRGPPRARGLPRAGPPTRMP
jgi:MOSC domain-containing protein YiiM